MVPTVPFAHSNKHGDNKMQTRLTRFYFTMASLALSASALASGQADGARDTASLTANVFDQADASVTVDALGSDQPLTLAQVLLAQKSDGSKAGGSGRSSDDDKDKDKDTNKKIFVYVCRVLRDGSFSTKKLLINTALKLIQQYPNRWLLGRCEDIISPS